MAPKSIPRKQKRASKRFACPVCDTTSRTANGLKRHRNVIHDDPVQCYKCPVCDRLSDRHGLLVKHLGADHGRSGETIRRSARVSRKEFLAEVLTQPSEEGKPPREEIQARKNKRRTRRTSAGSSGEESIVSRTSGMSRNQNLEDLSPDRLVVVIHDNGCPHESFGEDTTSGAETDRSETESAQGRPPASACPEPFVRSRSPSKERTVCASGSPNRPTRGTSLKSSTTKSPSKTTRSRPSPEKTTPLPESDQAEYKSETSKKRSHSKGYEEPRKTSKTELRSSQRSSRSSERSKERRSPTREKPKTHRAEQSKPAREVPTGLLSIVRTAMARRTEKRHRADRSSSRERESTPRPSQDRKKMEDRFSRDTYFTPPTTAMPSPRTPLDTREDKEDFVPMTQPVPRSSARQVTVAEDSPVVVAAKAPVPLFRTPSTEESDLPQSRGRNDSATWRLGPRPDNLTDYLPNRSVNVNLGAGNITAIVPIVEFPQPERVAVRYGPSLFDPATVADSGVYVTTQQLHETAFGQVSTSYVHRVTGMDISHPALRLGFWVPAQWGLGFDVVEEKSQATVRRE